MQTISLTLAPFLATQPVEKAWLFGSFARNQEESDSDIDILVRFTPNSRLSLFEYCRLVDKLESLLFRKVDLVEEGQLKPFAAASVEHDKLLIYERTT